MTDKKKAVAVLGLGRFGTYTVKELVENGMDVLIADKSEETVNRLSEFADIAVTCDLSDPDAVEKLGLGNMGTVIVAMGCSMEASITCTMIAKEAGVHRVIAKASSERMGKVLKKIGADEIIFPEKEMAIFMVDNILRKDRKKSETAD